jgi:ribosomal protein S18 acetylase RimI-like enzyme/DNA-binding transcriptional ArsR family regulator
LVTDMAMDFVVGQGALALGSRLKALSDTLYEAVDEVYRAHGLGVQSRWYPLLRMLGEQGPLTVGEIATGIGQSHSAVSQLASRLVRDGWLRAGGDRRDRRRRLLVLTPKTEAELKRLRPLWRAIQAAVEESIAETGHDFLAALGALENGLATRALADRTLDRCREDSQRELRIVPFAGELRDHFYRLNAEWLERFFYIERIDHEVLSQPEQHILEPGGAILFALLGEEVVGTCALLQQAPGVYELTKMAVTGSHQGLGIGRLLLEAAIAEFQARGGRELFLESNSRLKPALKLYERMGFRMQKSRRPGSHYKRSDVYMIWKAPVTRDAGDSAAS